MSHGPYVRVKSGHSIATFFVAYGQAEILTNLGHFSESLPLKLVDGIFFYVDKKSWMGS